MRLQVSKKKLKDGRGRCHTNIKKSLCHRIVNINKNHWVTLTLKIEDPNPQVIIYDSLHRLNTTPEPWKQILILITDTLTDCIKLQGSWRTHVGTIRHQPNDYDCGVFALAAAYNCPHLMEDNYSATRFRRWWVWQLLLDLEMDELNRGNDDQLTDDDLIVVEDCAEPIGRVKVAIPEAATEKSKGLYEKEAMLAGSSGCRSNKR